jgi:[CysO sulfur-carrier protein]-S-L-cysteine hydrolase
MNMIADLTEITAYLETKYPEEGCGLVFEETDGSFRVHPMANVYDKYHSRDPATYPRNNRTAYLFSPMEFQRLSEAADERKARLACIFHSHCDVGAYFSAEDKAMAAPDGQPLLPGTAYLVVAVDAGRTTKAVLFRWRSGEFVEEPLPSR